MIVPEISSEASLLQRAAERDPLAARTLIDQTSSVVYGFIYARVGGNPQAAEDLLQSTYLEAIRSARSFRGESALATWLCTIARRQVAGHFKSERRAWMLLSKLQLVGGDIDEENLEIESALMEGEAVIAALGRLTVAHRQVLVLKYMDGLSTVEVAKELGRTGPQVQSLLQRARAALRRALEASVDE